MILSDPVRLAELRATRLLDSEAEPSFDRLTRLAARLLDVPTALVSLVDDQRQFFKSCFGTLPAPFTRGTPLSHSFCQHVVIMGEPLIIEDARLDPLVRDNLAVRDLNVIAYAGIPLLTPAGHALGSLCAIDSVPRQWSDDQIAVLKDLAACVATEIALRFDIQERERAEEELRAVQQIKDELIGVVSHELRTPLTSLRGSLGLLASGRLDPGQSERMVGLAVANTDRLIRLINDFLDLERIKSGRFELQRVDINISEIVSSSVANIQADANRRAIELELDVTDAVIQVDADRMVQVLVNLLSNALKFSPENSVVTVSAAVRNDGFELSVIDRGRGIPEDMLATIFEPFAQVDASDSREKGGSGLGLPICRSIVAQHGGIITASSAPGEGSRFDIRIPLNDA
jgi:two-component system, sensor histidine kinase